MMSEAKETKPSRKPDFQGLTIGALESRRADDLRRMIEKNGGIASVAPSMREVPIEPNHDAINFAHAVMTGEINVVLFNTGVGFRFLMRAIERKVDQSRFLNSLRDIVTICRGPKPVAAMKEFDLKPTHRVPEPNTWREVLQTIDLGIPVANQCVAVQEYGVTNRSLVAGLEARGAVVRPLKVYGWEYPESTRPLEQKVADLIDGKDDLLLLTSAHQVVNLFRMAEELGRADDLRENWSRAVIASIGPTTSGMLEELELSVDIEPDHPKMGHLVVTAATAGVDLVKYRQRIRTLSPQPKETPPMHPSENGVFMKAVRGEATSRTPIWMMRQAGRYMGEYREVRAKTSFLELCQNPSLCAEVMNTAVERLDVDAAIIFSDLLPILIPMGFDLEYAAGDGPQIHNPIRSRDDLNRIQPIGRGESLDYVYETVRQTRAMIHDDIPVIGFAGSPFTLASYAIEGGGSKQYSATKRLMYAEPAAWQQLMEYLSESVTVYLNHQIDAGAQCVQLFDSWAGCLSAADYRKFILPSMKTILSGIRPDVPVINFATGNPELLPMLVGDQRTVVGVDWRIDLPTAIQRIGAHKSVQGNLDPAVLLSNSDTIWKAAKDLLESVNMRDGHVFNLGHGIFKETPPENAIELVRAVKELSQREVSP